jgi:predicted PhzF superfamily epimerase YddE/YHI9
LTTQVAATDGIRADFRSRFFRARVGFGEDPVTGSAHCSLGPYWSAKLGGKRQLTGYQSSPVRGGFLGVELPADQPDRVLIKGEGAVVLQGSLLSAP